MTTPLIREWMRTLIEGKIDPVEVTWFDLSGIDLMTPGNAGLLTECRPPFEKCVVLHRGPSKTHASYDVMIDILRQTQIKVELDKKAERERIAA